MKLRDLLQDLPGARVYGRDDADIAAVSYDSRQISPRSLFVAVPGFNRDGHDFIADAVARGAVAVVGERGLRELPIAAVRALGEGVCFVQVENSRQALALIAAAFYGHPSRRLRVIGVTGTNGKTTTTHLIRAILKRAGFRTGLIGTVQNYIGDDPRPVRQTTPEALDLQALLAEMVGRGCRYAVMEVSSHALDLGRVASTEFDAGVFTNLTQDHLDFHANLTRYAAAKAKLFAALGWGYGAARTAPAKDGAKYAVLNVDDASGGIMRSAGEAEVLCYGVVEDETQGLKPSAANAPPDVYATEIEVGSHGTSYTLVAPPGRIRLNLKLTGRFNVYNSLAAATVGLREGVSLQLVKEALEGIAGVAGRLEAVAEGQDFTVFVDYAHTPDGLENILQTAQELSQGRIIVVFGCGGDRDRTKRPIMGRLAARYADFTIITSDNPRSEDPDEIIAEIEAGVRAEDRGRNRYATIVDRERAIERAIAMAQPGDLILIAGKGHENYQIFRDRTICFDDREVAHAKLRQRLASRPRRPPLRGTVV